MASTILVKDIMSKDVRVVRPDTPAQEIVATLDKFNIDSVIVVQKDKPIGIVTVRDVMRRLSMEYVAPRILSAREMMSSPLTTINVEATVDEAAKLMARNNVKTLPVMDNDKMVGVVSFTDIAFKVPTLLSLLEESCHTTQ
ncbi:MAG TPA: CBS domain-containing protein [Candidatus Sulfotelmatobacter sp.]|nr:CBS domain-containing protein [Candidatus Sulfotelmatobacter sp.]